MENVLRRLISTETVRSRGLSSRLPTVMRKDDALCFGVVADLPEFEALETEWTDLFAASGQSHQAFQSFGWLATWARLYTGRRAHLCVVTGRSDGELVFVWPLVVQGICGLRVLCAMGDPLCQYSDALIAPAMPDAAVDAALDFVLALPFDLLSMRRVRDDAAIAPLLRRRLGAAVNRQASPFVDLTGADTVAAFENRFPGKLRASRRRRRRRLEEVGPVTFESHGPSPEAVTLVADALRFKRRWARDHGIVAPALRDPRFEAFFATAARAGATSPTLRVSVLRCGKEAAGIEISLVSGDRLIGHVLAPNPCFERWGAGGILAEATIHSALEQGFSCVDLLAPAHAYKLEWTGKTVGVGDYLAPLSLSGRLYAYLWLRSGRDLAKAAMHRIGPSVAKLKRRAWWRHAA